MAIFAQPPKMYNQPSMGAPHRPDRRGHAEGACPGGGYPCGTSLGTGACACRRGLRHTDGGIAANAMCCGRGSGATGAPSPPDHRAGAPRGRRSFVCSRGGLDRRLDAGEGKRCSDRAGRAWCVAAPHAAVGDLWRAEGLATHVCRLDRWTSVADVVDRFGRE